MKASTKAPAVTVSSKANAKEETKAKEVQTVKVNAEVSALIMSVADADAKVQVAVTQSNQTIIKLGDCVGTTMGKNEYAVTRASLAPLFVAAYTKTNSLSSARRPEDALKLYIGQQLARVMSIAYPGGKDASASERKAATKQLEAGKKAGLGTNALITLARGAAKLDKDESGKTVLIPIKNDNRGGGNKLTPIDTLKKTLESSLTAAKAADIDREQMLTLISDVLIALEMMDSETEQLIIAEQD